MGIPTMGMTTQESPPWECPLRNPHCGDPHHGNDHSGIPVVGIPTMGMTTQESPLWGFQSGDPHLGIPTMGMPTQESPLWEFLSGDPHLGKPTMGIYTRGRAIIMYGCAGGRGMGGAGGRATWQEVVQHGRRSCNMARGHASRYGGARGRAS